MKKMWILGLLPLMIPSAVSALSVNEALVNMVNTNPEIRERIENYREVEKDKTIAFSDYLPVVDVEGGIGRKHYNGTIPGFVTDDWTYTEAFIRARENLFRGFGTQNNVEQQDKRLISAEYFLMEKVSQLGLDMIDKYIEILKMKKLLDIAKENRDIHKEYYAKIKQRTASGAGTTADLEQVTGRLALAESNVQIAENNLLDAETNFARIYGQIVMPSELNEPHANKNLLPKSLESAEELAQRQYPSILAMQKNVEALKAAYRQAKENYYPWVDLELKQEYNNNDDSDALAGRLLAGEANQASAMVIVTWNLYNGGADSAAREKAAATMFKESDRMLNTKRLVSERLRLSWAAKERIAQQLKYLQKHRDYTKKTLASYKEEFTLGRRTLLDLLDVENESYTSKKAYITAQYDQILADYRVIENVGNLPKLINLKSKDVLQLQRYAKDERK